MLHSTAFRGWLLMTSQTNTEKKMDTSPMNPPYPDHQNPAPPTATSTTDPAIATKVPATATVRRLPTMSLLFTFRSSLGNETP